MSMARIVEFAYPGAKSLVNFEIRDDGDGPYPDPAKWAVPGVPLPTVEEIMEHEAAWLAAGGAILSKRAEAKKLFGVSVADRAIALAAGDGDNIIRAWIASFKTEVAAATSLNDLKARVAALPNLGQITPNQIKNAVLNRVDTNDANPA